MEAIHVKSEIGQLKKVLLHRPGRELLNLTPDTLESLLFDDIPFLEVAQKEHDYFASILREHGVEVVYLENLMAETLDHDSRLKNTFVTQYVKEVDGLSRHQQEAAIEYLLSIEDTMTLVLKTMEGLRASEMSDFHKESLADMVYTDQTMWIPPMPNLYFTRDPFASIGTGVSLHRMYSVTRRRETIYSSYIFQYHPDYKNNVPFLYDRYWPNHIEGGDILNISDTVLAVGISQRTSAEAIDLLAASIFSQASQTIDTILAFAIPKTRAFMHLDTVFTQVDRDVFTVHPGILGPLCVYEMKKTETGIDIVEKTETLEVILAEALNLPKVTLIPCAGGSTIESEREQWNDGSNTLCIAPGVIVVYDRNDVTNRILEEAGLTVLKVTSSELSRGRGGPRCMSMPLWREDLK